MIFPINLIMTMHFQESPLATGGKNNLPGQVSKYEIQRTWLVELLESFKPS